MILRPTAAEIATIENEPKPETLDSRLLPAKERQEVSREETTPCTITHYNDGTIRVDWQVSQEPVVQPTSGLPIQ